MGYLFTCRSWILWMWQLINQYTKSLSGFGLERKNRLISPFLDQCQIAQAQVNPGVLASKLNMSQGCVPRTKGGSCWAEQCHQVEGRDPSPPLSLCETHLEQSGLPSMRQTWRESSKGPPGWFRPWSICQTRRGESWDCPACRRGDSGESSKCV